MRTVVALGFIIALVNWPAGMIGASSTSFVRGGGGGKGPASLDFANGVFYGTNSAVGKYGTLFGLTPGGAERVLYSFKGKPDGDTPVANLIEVNGAFYGTTEYGGQYGAGTVFAVTAAGKERVLHSFKGKPDGEYPIAGLVYANGVFYGTTEYGGQYGVGTVFAVTTAGTERVVHSFAAGWADGAYPEAGLIDVNGVLYGTTADGGRADAGTVFALTAAGTERVLHEFCVPLETDGAHPNAGLVYANGVLYGTTEYGGQYEDQGTVFAVTTAGTERVLHSFVGFVGGAEDGALPAAGLIRVDGVLYGTTVKGGSGAACGKAAGCGTVFAVTVAGTERVLYSFKGPPDGDYPLAGLIDVSDVLYGTAFGGRKDGIVFGVTPAGVEHVLYSF